MTSKSSDQVFYSQIRTPNMLPDRSADITFSEDEPSLTQQQYVRECDINHIVASNAATGLLTHVNQNTPHFGDFGTSVDYHSALNYLREADSSFMGLDAHIRDRFHNNPAELLDFVSKSENIEEAVKLGLATYVSVPDPTPSPAKPEKPPKTPPTQAGE